MTIRRSLAVSVVSSTRMLVKKFLLDRTASLSAMHCQCLLGGFIVTIKMGKSTLSRLDVSASLGLLQYCRVYSNNDDMDTHYTYNLLVYYLIVRGIYFSCNFKTCFK